MNHKTTYTALYLATIACIATYGAWIWCTQPGEYHEVLFSLSCALCLLILVHVRRWEIDRDAEPLAVALKLFLGPVIGCIMGSNAYINAQRHPTLIDQHTSLQAIYALTMALAIACCMRMAWEIFAYVRHRSAAQKHLR